MARKNAINLNLERDQSSLLYDTRSIGARMRDMLSDEGPPFVIMSFLAAVLFIYPAFAEAIVVIGFAFFFYVRFVQNGAGLALRMPKSSGEIDPKQLSLGAKPRPENAEGIVYMGNDMDNGEEVWMTDTQARTHMLFMGTTGSGKSQPLDAKVMTPAGWKLMGNLRVGDLVSTPDGQAAPITGVFPQGELDIYRITFEDGRSTEASAEHLWEVHHKHWNGKFKPGVSCAGAARPRTITTQQIIDLKASNAGKFSVRLTTPVLQERKDLPLNPYLLGALLGDGGLSGGNVRFSSDDAEILEAVAEACPAGVTLKNYPGCQHPRDYILADPRGRNSGGVYAVNPVRVELEKMGLMGCLSGDKFIPELYKMGSAEQRLLVLKGLMDTDGFAGASGSASFCSVSKRLAEDVQYLVRSLGGIARISTKVPTYTHKGEKRHGQLAYIVNIRHPDPAGLFALPRKSERLFDYQYADSLKLGIEKVELVGRKQAQCIMVDHPDHLYITDDFIVTHNTEYLISLVYNALIHGSGFIYVDGKADSSLYGKMYSMARAMGREDDVLVMNFQTGAKDIYGAQPNKLSNTLNPFANGSSGMLSELVKGLMATGEKSTWTQQAESFVEALLKPLVYLRDHHGLNLDVNVIRTYFELNQLEDLAWRDGDKYPGLVESGVLDGLHNYLITKPAYKRDKYHDQSETTNEQHGYITMQLIRTFNSLADTYGYIMKTPLAEIDFVDVFLNRRILVVLLPALEKSPSELTNLGRIVVASIKATMAKGLGSALEGSWKKVISAKPTTAPSPFMCVLDEYGYYAVEGFAVVPAQARSLGFSAIFAGQDLPAFEKASKEEAKSTLANTNTRLCGKLECTQTYQFFKDIAGSGTFTKVQRYEHKTDLIASSSSFKSDDGISIERIDRVSFEALRGQASGEWHMFFANTILRVRSFFSNPTPVKNLRVNHFIKVGRPDKEEIAAFRETYDLFTRAVSSEGGLMSFMDRVSSPSDIAEIHEAFEAFKGDDALLRAGKVLAFCAQKEDRRSRAFMEMTAAGFATGVQEIDSTAPIDFAKHMGGEPFAADADDGMEFIDAAGERRPVTGSNFGNESGHAALRQGHFSDHDPFENRSLDEDDDATRAEISDPDDSLYSTPDHAIEASQGGNDWERDPSFNFDDESTPATRAQLIPAAAAEEAQFFNQTSVFGADNYRVPEAVSGADNDSDADAMDRPYDVEHAGDGETALWPVDAFDAPMASDGLLSLEATVSGLAAIERLAGAPESESQQTALAVAEAIAGSTKYPITTPSKKVDLAHFELVARKLSHLISVSADKED